MIITSIKPNVTREQAVTKFRGVFNELRHGRLRIAAPFYIPYRFFQLIWSEGKRTYLAADAVTGKLDLIQFDQLPVERDRISVETEMVAAERVTEDEAYRLVQESAMRSIFMKGVFKSSKAKADIKLATGLHTPYWVGVYDRQGRAHLEIINALQGRFEGAKLRDIVVEWFQ